MRMFDQSWFDRKLNGGGNWSVTSVLLSPILLPVYFMQLILTLTLGFIILVVMCSYPIALAQVARAVRVARAGDKTDDTPKKWRGGEFRQAGYQQKGSLIRPGGSLNSDDLRRRLDELRSTDPGGPGHRALNRGGQNGQQ